MHSSSKLEARWYRTACTLALICLPHQITVAPRTIASMQYLSGRTSSDFEDAVTAINSGSLCSIHACSNDQFGPKVLVSSSCLHYRLNICSTDWQAFVFDQELLCVVAYWKEFKPTVQCKLCGQSSVNPFLMKHHHTKKVGTREKKTRFTGLFFLTGLRPVLPLCQWLPSKPWPERVNYTIRFIL